MNIENVLGAGRDGIASAGVGYILPVLAVTLAYYYYPASGQELPVINTPTDMLLPAYDFIVVGAGSAGAVVASRLSEVENWNVLLLEAGSDETEITDVPLVAKWLQHSELDWEYKTEPQSKACLATDNGRCEWPRGKVLGGTSVLNFMMYVRGNRKDYDNWERQGNLGWSFRHVLPYFKKSEDNKNPNLANSIYHSTGGYLTVEEAPWHRPLATAFVEAGREMGYEIGDINGARQTGFMIAQGTIRDGRRCSTAKAFLRPARLRNNLDIAMESHVTKILIDPLTEIAYGVEMMRNGALHRVRATKEVIVSAGSVNSPQLLMLSGIGPTDHLEQHNIFVIQNSSVGNNLQDHVDICGPAFMTNDESLMVENRLRSNSTVTIYAVFGNGPLTVPGGLEGLAFVNTKYANPTKDYPDIELHFGSGSSCRGSSRPLIKAHNLAERFFDAVSELKDTSDIWIIAPALLRPKSRGFIRLRSNNPFDHPLIDPNYFSDPEDLATLMEGIKIGVGLSRTNVFQRYGSELNPKIFPACEHIPLYMDAYWECVIRQYASTLYHPVGTCKMGPRWDPDAVVDSELRVYGIQRLRVIDASIMPTIVSGDTNGATIMIAEKGSDMIKEFWLKKPRPSKYFK